MYMIRFVAIKCSYQSVEKENCAYLVITYHWSLFQMQNKMPNPCEFLCQQELVGGFNPSEKD